MSPPADLIEDVYLFPKSERKKVFSHSDKLFFLVQNIDNLLQYSKGTYYESETVTYSCLNLYLKEQLLKMILAGTTTQHFQKKTIRKYTIMIAQKIWGWQPWNYDGWITRHINYFLLFANRDLRKNVNWPSSQE